MKTAIFQMLKENLIELIDNQKKEKTYASITQQENQNVQESEENYRQLGTTKALFKLQFRGNSLAKYINPQTLKNELDRVQQNLGRHIKIVYVDQKNILTIKTTDDSCLKDLCTWPDDAFETGITEVNKKKTFYLCIKNFNIDYVLDEETLKENGITDYQRIIKKSSNEATKCIIEEDIFHHIHNSYKNVIIMGDFNANHTSWCCKANNPRGIQLDNKGNTT
jgi:hypothetical protein